MNLKELLSAGMGKMRPTQHPVGRMENISIKYFESNHQLHFKSLCNSSENRRIKYQLQLVFNKVPSSDEQNREFPLRYSEPGSLKFLSIPSDNNSVQLRCSCADNYFMWQYQNKNSGSLLGGYKPYIKKTNAPYRNYLNVPGVCKHLMYLIRILNENRLVTLSPSVRDFVIKSLVSIK